MICPTALSTITLVMNEIDPEAKKISSGFSITTDPERDTIDRLNEYLQSFHPATIGLTGFKSIFRKKLIQGIKFMQRKLKVME